MLPCFPMWFRLKRTEAIKTELKSIYLELSANEYFTTFLERDSTGSEERPYTEMLKFRIDFSDFYSTLGRMASRVCRRVFRT